MIFQRHPQHPAHTANLLSRLGRAGRACNYLLIFLISIPLLPVAAQQPATQDRAPSRDLFLDSIERNIKMGQHREALQILSTLRAQDYQTTDEARFVYLEAQALLANGYPEEAHRRIELLRTLDGWELSVEESELLEVEVQILKAVGQPLDALGIVEEDLPPLDLIDPPYPIDVTQRFLLYGDLLMAVGRYDEGVQTFFDLMENGARRFRDDCIRALLRAGQLGVLQPGDFEKILASLTAQPGIGLWSDFSEAAHASGYDHFAGVFISESFKKFAPMLREEWQTFLDRQEPGEYLDLILETVDLVLEETPEVKSLDQKMIAAMTFQKVGNRDKAITLTRELAEGNDLGLQLFAAKTFAAEGYFDEASAIYEKLDALAPGRHLDAWGALYADAGNLEKAFEIWAKIPEKNGHSIEGYLSWGRLLKERGYLEQSRDALLEGIAKTGRAAPYAYELLEVSLSLTDVEGALTAYQSLREQSAGSNQSIWTPGRLLNQLKRTQQAEAFAEKLSEVLDATATVQAVWRDFAVELATDLALHLNETDILEKWATSPPPTLTAYWEGVPMRQIHHFLNLGAELSHRGEDELAVKFLDRIDPPYFDLRLDSAQAAARSHEELGQVDRAIQYWEIVHQSNRASRTHQREAELAIARLHLADYRAGQALEWLNRIDESKESRTTLSELKFLKGLAYTRLHEKRKALELLEEVLTLGTRNAADALFWLAEWEMWQRNYEEAENLYRQTLTRDPGQTLANESLLRLQHLKQLEEEQIPAYSLAAFFEAAGAWTEAEENYRKLAGLLPQGDLSDWVYFRLGALFFENDRTEEAIDQWSLLLDRTQSETLRRRVKFEMQKVLASDRPEAFEQILTEDPNSLVGDLARDAMISAQQKETEDGLSPLP